MSPVGDSVKSVIYGVSLFGYTDIMEARDHALELNARAAEILSDRRDHLGLSLRQIEQKSGVNYMTVKRLLDGTREMRMDDFKAIANALGLSAWRVVQQAEQDADTREPAPVTPFPTRTERTVDLNSVAAKHSHSRFHEGLDEDEMSQVDP